MHFCGFIPVPENEWKFSVAMKIIDVSRNNAVPRRPDAKMQSRIPCPETPSGQSSGCINLFRHVCISSIGKISVKA